jgi:hypothetical protein
MTQEVEAFAEGDDTRLALIESQTPGRQPSGQPRFDHFGLLTTNTECDEVVCVAHHHRRARHRPPGVNASWVITDSSGFFHPVQGNVQQHWGDHPAL